MKHPVPSVPDIRLQCQTFFVESFIPFFDALSKPTIRSLLALHSWTASIAHHPGSNLAAMASQMELISCHEPTAGSFSVTFLLKNVRHMLSFCLECIKNIEYRFCEGTTQVGYDPEGPCTHLTPPYVCRFQHMRLSTDKCSDTPPLTPFHLLALASCLGDQQSI